ncbi:MAG TPA: DUF1801 domain-containing protein [Acidimicrobiales bacterium]|nr:DUF1801 domain-containing protein [Acidimicrobiales bacterium]
MNAWRTTSSAITLTCHAAAKLKRPSAPPAASYTVCIVTGWHSRGTGRAKRTTSDSRTWKRDVGRRLDALIVRTVPGVRKAVKWNSPFYGVEDRGWFLNFHCFTRYVKVAFFRGTSLRPVPPGESKHEETRYLDIHEDDEVDAAQFADWVEQASRLPGEKL